VGLGPVSLLGRGDELADLVDRLRSHRLVTVMGPGGVGKTTLARQGASEVAHRFPLGVRFVDLGRVETPDAVAGSFAAQLGFASFDALLTSPIDQPALVIADNCEHLLDPVATAVGTLLECCEAPTVLATSRSPLGLPGESIVALTPLHVPRDDDPLAEQSPVVQLFLARARDAGAVLGQRDIGAVVALCARLDGLPLAVEIAAARTRTMSAAELLARVEEGVEVLSRPRFRGPARHRSVSDVVRWSTDRLGAAEVDLLERLAVLNGRFSLDTARRIGCDAASFDGAFDELLHASLVAVDTTGETTMFRVLDVVRHVALARLRSRGEYDDRYDRFVDTVVSAVWDRLTGTGLRWDPATLRDAMSSFDDVATAIRWCVAHDPEPDRALSLCSALLVLVEQGRADDVLSSTREVFQRWPAALTSGDPVAAEAVATLANAENLAGRAELGLQLARGALAALKEPALADVTLRQAIGDCSVTLGDRPAAAAAYAEAAVSARDRGLTPVALELELAQAQLRADAGSVEAALSGIDDVVAAARDLDATLTLLWAEVVRAWVTVRVDRRRAAALIDTSLPACQEAGYPNGVAAALRSRAFCCVLDDDLAGAADAIEQLREQIVEHQSLANLRMLVDASAALAHRAGHPAWERLWATVDTLPPATLVAARGYALVPLPGTEAAPLTARDAFRVVRSLAADVRQGALTAPGAVVPARPRMRKAGDVWEISFGGRVVSVRTTKGLDTVARLLAAPGREIHCLDLMGAVAEQGSTGEVIDAVARRRYEERIRELQSELDEAEADHDTGRAERAQIEFDAIVDHLTAALGRGGATRRASDSAERARSAVTHRVRAALRALDQTHQPLAHHLRRSIVTGTYCSYQPEQAVAWEVRF
jgi:predicted ATPase